MDVNVFPGLWVAQGQGHITTDGWASLVLADRLLPIVLGKPSRLQGVGQGTKIFRRVLHELVFYVASCLSLVVVAVPVNIIDAPILG